ncbi:MAG: putative toxin-antitoxin system toxin component, PIN family [Prevotella sp.]|nr:putative toxin-antitoxin system toxin component, PIN family [Prevotella sp.]
MRNNRIVLDTNCLVAALAKHSEFHSVWKGLQEGQYRLCVTNEILEEYQEIIALKTSAIVAENVINLLLKSEYVMFVDTYFRLELIAADPDDNKFVDCAFAADAAYIVSDDKHFEILKSINFPKISVLKLREFIKYL